MISLFWHISSIKYIYLFNVSCFYPSWQSESHKTESLEQWIKSHLLEELSVVTEYGPTLVFYTLIVCEYKLKKKKKMDAMK